MIGRSGGVALFRFLHAADIHLDSPLRGLERYPGAPLEEIRGAPRRALENLVALAIEERVAFVLIAGDLYDGDWKDYHTGLFFAQQMRRLEEAGIPVHLIAGNHDFASRISRRLSLPANVTRHADAAPQTVLLEEHGVAIHGQSFASRSVPDDLAAGYPAGAPDRFDIGLLHTSLDGREGHADYAPCSVEGLRAKGYDYWALGHVHRREEVSRDPWIVFPGNLQGRHARETGAKGATLVRVEDHRVVSVEHRPLDAVRWARVEVGLGAEDAPADALERAQEALAEAVEGAEGRLVCARLVLRGACPAHDAWAREPERWLHEIRETAGTLALPGVWLERVLFETSPVRDLAGALEREDALGELLRGISEPGVAEPALEELAGEFAELRKRLPPALLDPGEQVDPGRIETLRAALPAVRELLLARLLEAGEPE